MKKNLLIHTLWFLLAACGGEEVQQGTTPDLKYRTTAPSLLYFKNIRSSNYEQSQQPGTRIDCYQLRKFGQLAQEPLLIPIIANNWLEDEAYILLEPASFGQGLAEPITIRWEAQERKEIYQLIPATADKQYELAMQLYESLQAGHHLEAMAVDSTWATIMGSQSSRSHFATTIRDYLRLTEAL